MLYSCKAAFGRHYSLLVAMGFALLLGCLSRSARADDTTLYFTGTCGDCTGTASMSVTVSNLVQGAQYGVPATILYSSSILGNLSSAAGAGQIFSGYVDTTVLPGYQVMEVSFDANGTPYAFTSCSNVASVSSGGSHICGTDAQVAAGQAYLGFGDWAIASNAFFSPTSQLPGGVGSKVQDFGTNGIWSLTPPATMAAPEIDPTSAASALMLLLGGLAVLRGKRIPVVRDAI